MAKALCAALGFCAALSAAAGLAEARPKPLTAPEMDAVTAGAVDVGVLSTAGATGAFNHTTTSGVAAAFSVQGPHPAISAQIGVAAGTATAVAGGDGASTTTSVSTSGSASGTFTVSSSTSWTLRVLSGEISGGFTWVSGRTGVFLLGGP
jgi:hypothetical protein